MNSEDKDVTSPQSRRRKRVHDVTKVERKRELDRIAQRATRERTKNRIADLEQRLASLESGDRNGEVARLTKTIGELREENGKYRTALVKMRFAINEALGETESASRETQSTPSDDDFDVNPDAETATCISPGTTQPSNDSRVNHLINAGLPMQADTSAQRLQSMYQSQGLRAPAPGNSANFDISSVYEFFDYDPSTSLGVSSLLDMHMPSVQMYAYIAPDEQKWKTSDDAFHRGLAAAPRVNMNFNTASLTRAILFGWDTIGIECQHPLFATLRCVDERVFGKWTSRAQRLALQYICACLMRWRAHPHAETKAKIPPWFLPRPAQDRIQHPLVIDFLVWPGLRERLVFEYEKYSTMGKFSFAFVEYFHFHWPYPDEQVAQYDPSTGAITGLSPMFLQYVFDLKKWTMLPDFFNEFPEMRADIEMFDEPRTTVAGEAWG